MSCGADASLSCSVVRDCQSLSSRRKCRFRVVGTMVGRAVEIWRKDMALRGRREERRVAAEVSVFLLVRGVSNRRRRRRCGKFMYAM